MSRSTRLTLLILGIFLILLALLAIAYALSPLEINRSISTLSPGMIPVP